jgi:hypothetical protein
MTNANRLFAAAAGLVLMSSSAGFAAATSQFSYGENTVNSNDDTAISRRAVRTGYDVNLLPSNIVALERRETRNINYFTGRTTSGQN